MLNEKKTNEVRNRQRVYESANVRALISILNSFTLPSQMKESSRSIAVAAAADAAATETV